MLVAGVMGLSVARSLADRTTVLLAGRDIAEGETISSEDLVTAEVALDPRIGFIDPSTRDEVVGQVAARPISNGTIVQTVDFAATGADEEAEVILGAALDAGNYPRVGLRPGDLIGLIEVSDAGLGEVVGDSRQVGEAEVVETVRITRSDHLLVSVRLKESLAVTVSQLAEEDRLRLVILDAAEDSTLLPVEPVQPADPADPDDISTSPGDASGTDTSTGDDGGGR